MAVVLATWLGALPGPGVAKETAKQTPAPPPASGDLAAVLAAVREPGASAVLVNVWATWCEPCRQEMPEIVRFYRDHRAGGLRLVLVSADDPESRREVARFLAKVGVGVGVGVGADAAGARLFIKTGDDMAFINGLDARWSGAVPASFLFDGRGQERHFWPGRVTLPDLEGGLAEIAGHASDATNKKTKGHP
jgi:thiol-disulfide isomerase/thioredoxin